MIAIITDTDRCIIGLNRTYSVATGDIFTWCVGFILNACSIIFWILVIAIIADTNGVIIFVYSTDTMFTACDTFAGGFAVEIVCRA